MPKSTNKDSVEFKRAMASIRVYALNRADLVADRSQLILGIDHRINLISVLKTIQEDVKTANLTDAADAIADLIASEIDVLLDMQKPERPYAGLDQQLIKEMDPSN